MILSPENTYKIVNDLESAASKDRFWEIMRKIGDDVASQVRVAAGGGEGSVIAMYRLANRFTGIVPNEESISIFFNARELHDYDVGLENRAFQGRFVVAEGYRLLPSANNQVKMAVDFLPEVSLDHYVDSMKSISISLKEGAVKGELLLTRLAEKSGATTTTKPLVVHKLFIKDTPPTKFFDSVFGNQKTSELFMLSIHDPKTSKLLMNL